MHEKKCEILREYSKRISNFGKKKEIPLTNGNNESYEKTKDITNDKYSYNYQQSPMINTLIIKFIVTSKTIIITLINIEVLHIARETENMVCQKKSL